MFPLLAETPDPTWFGFIERVGFPIACACGLFWLLYTLLKPQTERHFKLVDEVAATNKQMGEASIKMAAATEAISSRLTQVQEAQEDQGRDLHQIKERVSKP